MPYNLFPSNGLDRSLHAPILIGMLFVTFFTEAFGWTYAGLVVPGYLAAVFVAAPFTGFLTVFEAFTTYALVAAIGRWAPKTGVWSTAFGRERFFLFIVCGVLVRYMMEGYVCPQLTARYSFEHARELYSVGLVIIPLFANVFWNTGATSSAPRLFVISGLTYVIVRFVLLRYTNYSLSRFLIANESGALDFLASSKAQIILLVGAFLGARSNVLYGWDFNGILVPALLGVAWYEPKKLISTIVEAIVVYLISVGLMALPPFSRMLIVGTRRMLVAGIVGFILKMGIGFTLQRYMPGVLLVDYLGFGYILPSLLAVKMWNRGHMGVVLMPTVQVSLTAFLCGNAVGYGLSWLRGATAIVEEAITPPTVLPSAPFQLALGDVTPEPPSFWSRADARDRYRVAVDVARQLRDTSKVSRSLLDLAKSKHVRVTTHLDEHGGWSAMTPLPVDPELFEPAPRFAVRLAPSGAQPWLIVVESPGAGSPVFDVAMHLAEVMDARAVAIVSRYSDVASLDTEAIVALSGAVGADRVLVVEEHNAATSALSIAGAWPLGLDTGAVERSLDMTVAVEWRARASSPSALSDVPRLRLAVADAARVGVALAGDVGIERWSGPLEREIPARLESLTTVDARGPMPPGIDELRLFRASVATSITGLEAGEEPAAWSRIVAARLGFRLARVGGEQVEAWVLHEPARPGRRGHPSLFVRPGTGLMPLVIEVPAPRWELGSAAAGVAMLDALSARGLLIAGALPNAEPSGKVDPRRVEGRRNYFQLAHEVWLARGAHTLSLQGIIPERAPPEDAVLSTGRELAPDDEEPSWTKPIRASLESLGYSVARLDGARSHAPFGGGGDPTMGFADKFAQGQHAVLWMSPRLRQMFAQRGDPERPRSDVFRLPAGLTSLDVATRSFELIACARAIHEGAASPGCPVISTDTCDLAAESRRWTLFSEEHNPHDLRAALSSTGHGCAVEVARDDASLTYWATLASATEAIVVPVGGPPAEHVSVPLSSPAAVRQGITLRISSLRVVP